jgi:TRAP-type uncharacterized transport system fused permease subunit
MKTKFILPNKFKKLGAFLMPAGLIIWCLAQHAEPAYPQWIRVSILCLSFFSFLFGFYFLMFSKERVEDEFINATRLHSFQIAALSQVLFFIFSFIFMFVAHKEPAGDGGLVDFLLAAIAVFWLVYMIYFNLTLLTNRARANEK